MVYSQPKQILDKMMTNFIDNSTKLLKLTTSKELIEKEKGIYGKIFVRPSKRLAKLLSVQREILVLFINFQDLQQRTIKTAREIIDAESGRLESTVAIIVHQDNSGNSKLRNWGREDGISVLPVFYGQDGLPTDEDNFEKLLCKELFSYDPFDVMGPVSDDSQFYGRRTEALDLARQLQVGQIKSCLGIRKIGKTSIINRVINETRNQHHCYCVMIDCSKDEIWKMDAERLLDTLANAINKAMKSSDRYAVLEAHQNISTIPESSQKLLLAINSSEYPIILFFDEVDYITPGSPIATHWKEEFNTFWRNLRTIYQEAFRVRKTISILLSGVSSKWFSIESINGIENAALAFIPEEYLSPLQINASIAMIKTIARICGLQFDDANAKNIAEVCSNIPFWIRKACSYIHRQIEIEIRPYKPEEDLVSSLLNKFVENEGGALAKVALTHLFRVYPELENVSIECYNNQTEKCSKYYLNILERYGILIKRNKSYSLSGSMVIEGIKLYLESTIIQPEFETLVNSSHNRTGLNYENINEWAEDLALINKRRNILEKKLRDIVLNFIRFDSLQNKGKGKAKERLLKILEENRRSQIERLSDEEVINKYNWTDLVKLINKEWTLFEKIFIDKNDFKLNCSLINDRFDTHAKDADIADIALYRRALKQLEDNISSMS